MSEDWLPPDPGLRRAELRRRIARIHDRRRELDTEEAHLQALLAESWPVEMRRIVSPALAILEEHAMRVRHEGPEELFVGWPE